jgi:hypothetical protein
MHNSVAIENIEELRRREGIDDVELRAEVGRLRVGDHVKITLRGGESHGGETLAVRITTIRGDGFRGKLACDPASAGLAGLRAGSPVAFTTAHIHSVAKGRPGPKPPPLPQPESRR